MRVKENYVKYVILMFSICFILIGIYRDETLTVLKKATNICLECIGIG